MEENINRQKPDNFLVWAVLSTVMCCVPTGVVAILYSNKVDGLWNAGQYDEAEEALRKAKMWTYISAGTGVLAVVVAFFFYLLGFIIAINS